MEWHTFNILENNSRTLLVDYEDAAGTDICLTLDDRLIILTPQEATKLATTLLCAAGTVNINYCLVEDFLRQHELNTSPILNLAEHTEPD